MLYFSSNIFHFESMLISFFNNIFFLKFASVNINFFRNKIFSVNSHNFLILIYDFWIVSVFVTASVFMAQVFHSVFILTDMVFYFCPHSCNLMGKTSYMVFLRVQNRTQMANLNLAQKCVASCQLKFI